MNKLSRRALAKWAADQLTSGKSAADVAKHLAAALVASNLSHQVEFLINDIAWELEQRQALVVGKVTTAHKLPAQLESALKAQIKDLTKAEEVTMENIVDKSILGGIRVETSQHIWDQTISRKLVQLKEVFNG